MYIDKVLLFSKTRKEHIRHPTLVFENLKCYGLIFYKDKCIFDVKEIVFLGHKMNPEGVAPLESKVTAIQNFPRPSNVKRLRRFSDMLNYYRRFIPAAAPTLQPLNRMVSPLSTADKLYIGTRRQKKLFLPLKPSLPVQP